MDSLCQYINRSININSEREKYTKMYDTVRNEIINGLKMDENFKLLFSDLKLCGSYADNLKISKPDEFDLVICFQFPHNDQVEISPDNVNRGNVFINISEIFARLELEKNNLARKFLQGMVNSKNYFLEDKFQNWLQGCFARLLKRLGNRVIHTDGSMLSLRYRRQGPAHTLEVTNFPHEFAIDFVPGFLFKASKKICRRQVTSEYWQAIPKPMHVKENKSFRTSYTDSERKLFAGKEQFKAILRMMKKFRDSKAKMVNLKSYYLKTIFLWHDENCNPNFWRKPSIELVQEMFAVLETALATQMIPFFWDKNLNLLGPMSKDQIKSMYHEVAAARKILKQPRGQFASIFLTEEEQKEYYKDQKSEEVDMDELCKQISRVISTNCQKDASVCSKLEFVQNKFMNQLKINKHFCLLFHSTQISGDYVDNLDVSKHRIVMCLQLPHKNDVAISQDSVSTGNVFINIATVLDRLEKDKKDDACKFLQKMVNLKKYLLEDKIQSWFEGCVLTALRQLNGQLMYCDGTTLNLRHRKHGAAHRINVTYNKLSLAIDFVPAFLIEASKKICKREVTAHFWQAIPEPRGVRDNMSFRPSYDDSERREFVGLNQFKNTLRMMKKFRDNKPAMVNLKCYHIKTLFLWSNEEYGHMFWTQPTIEILHVMFKKLRDALEKGEIPSFWEKKLNLLSSLSRNQVDSMYSEVKRALYVLMHPESPKDFLAIFLNIEERMREHESLVVTTETDVVPRTFSVDRETERPLEEDSCQSMLGTMNLRDYEPSIVTTNVEGRASATTRNRLLLGGVIVAAAVSLYTAFRAANRERRNQ